MDFMTPACRGGFIPHPSVMNLKSVKTDIPVTMSTTAYIRAMSISRMTANGHMVMRIRMHIT